MESHMKRFFALALICMILLSGCGTSNQALKNANGTLAVDSGAVNPTHETAVDKPSGDDVIEIREKLFVAQTNDIYFNAGDYLGKTIRLEGVFDVFDDPNTGTTYRSVIRYGPGCCGIDANPGFEVDWEGGYPSQNDWVEATGVLVEYDEGGYKYLRLALTELNVLDERGAEYVVQ
jgi:uncharacterized membrane protein YcgQ (UPF0703/DUF1980 family)